MHTRVIAWFLYEVIVLAFLAFLNRPLTAQDRVQPSVARDAESETRAGGEPQGMERANQAIRKAKSTLGFPEAMEMGAEVVTLEDDSTPYLSNEIAGRRAFRITVETGKGASRSPGDEKLGLERRTYDVFVGEDGGKLLKVVSRWPNGTSPFAEEVDAATAAQRLAMGTERY